MLLGRFGFTVVMVQIVCCPISTVMIASLNEAIAFAKPLAGLLSDGSSDGENHGLRLVGVSGEQVVYECGYVGLDLDRCQRREVVRLDVDMDDGAVHR
jgi:hypothetical protein